MGKLVSYTYVGEMGQVGETDQETNHKFEMNFSLASTKFQKKCVCQKLFATKIWST